MKKILLKMRMFIYKDYTVNYTRINNDKYGNPRYEVTIYTPQEVSYLIKFPDTEITGITYRKTSYNIEQDIKEYINNEINKRWFWTN